MPENNNTYVVVSPNTASAITVLALIGVTALAVLGTKEWEPITRFLFFVFRRFYKGYMRPLRKEKSCPSPLP